MSHRDERIRFSRYNLLPLSAVHAAMERLEREIDEEVRESGEPELVRRWARLSSPDEAMKLFGVSGNLREDYRDFGAYVLRREAEALAQWFAEAGKVA